MEILTKMITFNEIQYSSDLFRLQSCSHNYFEMQFLAAFIKSVVG